METEDSVVLRASEEEISVAISNKVLAQFTQKTPSVGPKDWARGTQD
jgi:hypothetical protein